MITVTPFDAANLSSSGIVLGRRWNENNILVVLGEHDRSRTEGTEQEFSVDCVHIHRRYVKGVPYNNDIAVVKLKTSPGHDVVINDFVMPACMPEKNEFRAGDICYVTGWGYTSKDCYFYPRKTFRIFL